MTKINNAIETLRYGYKPGEFFPIMSGGELLNKKEFVSYKLRCLIVKKSLI